MNEELVVQTILTFEKYLSRSETDAEALGTAQSRGWIDSEGRPTEEGVRLFAALASQSDTRSAFRNLVWA
jgi:hypothetical protein